MDASDRVATVRLAVVETAAALTWAARLGRLTAVQNLDVMNQADYLFGLIDMIEIDATLVDHAVSLAERYFLRGYDAVHLASAFAVNDSGLVFVAGDRDLLQAAELSGLSTASANFGS